MLFSFGGFMRFFISIVSFLLVFVTFIHAQDQSRPQKFEELRRIAAQIEQMENQLDQIRERREEISSEMLNVSDEDREEAERVGAKATRLFPDGILNKLIDAPDEVGFSIYSFTEISNYYSEPRLEFKNNSLKFYKESDNQESFVFIADIGKSEFEKIDEQSREIISLSKFQPPTKIKDVKREIVSDNLTFGQSVSVIVGNTYLVRAFSYEKGDGIFAVKIHRKDNDESIVILVKTIKTFESSQVKNNDSTKQIQKQGNSSQTPDYERLQKVQNAMLLKGFYDVTVDSSTTPMILRGTVPKGKLAEAIQTAVNANGGKPIINQLTEQ